ncbi:MAG: ATP synthase F0 subunit C [Myxococcaceae bacterium]|nr:ATP synthase F0 subunit C [Myxococcaceae bacterium]
MTSAALAFLSAGIGAGLVIIGIGFGIGKLAAAALDGIARQPSATGDLRATMIVAAGLVEGAGLFALVICILLALKG